MVVAEVNDTVISDEASRLKMTDSSAADGAVTDFTQQELDIMTALLFETCDGSGNGQVTELELGLLKNSGLHRFWMWMSETESIHDKKRSVLPASLLALLNP